MRTFRTSRVQITPSTYGVRTSFRVRRVAHRHDVGAERCPNDDCVRRRHVRSRERIRRRDGGRFTAKTSGIYFVNCQVEFQANTTGQSDWTAILVRNGVETGATDVGLTTNSPTFGESAGVSRMLALTAGDSLVCDAFQNSQGGAAASLAVGSQARSFFSAARIY